VIGRITLQRFCRVTRKLLYAKQPKWDGKEERVQKGEEENKR
jgi:hypothetical protein